MSSEEYLLLWVFHATNAKSGVISHTYAHTENEARIQMSPWMAEQVASGLADIEVKHYPGGFMPGQSTRWPGRIPASALRQSGESEVKP